VVVLSTTRDINRSHKVRCQERPELFSPSPRGQAFGTCSNLPAQWGGTRFGVAAARGFKCHNTARQLLQIWTSSPQIDIGGARHSLQRPSPVSTGAAGTGKPVHAAACCRQACTERDGQSGRVLAGEISARTLVAAMMARRRGALATRRAGHSRSQLKGLGSIRPESRPTGSTRLRVGKHHQESPRQGTGEKRPRRTGADPHHNNGVGPAQRRCRVIENGETAGQVP
jgi:hypothetical protein